MRLKEFTAPKDTVLTQVGINPNPDVDADQHNPNGMFSPLGTIQKRPVPLTANHAVVVDKRVKELKKRKVDEGHRTLPPIDTERYTERRGLEGPMRARNGRVVYYDPKEGQYYDPDTDMYISNDDWEAMNR
jgi:hypothetical protein